MKLLAYIVFGLDKVLYKTLGIVTPIRRVYWRRRAKAIQRMLNAEHRTNI